MTCTLYTEHEFGMRACVGDCDPCRATGTVLAECPDCDGRGYNDVGHADRSHAERCTECVGGFVHVDAPDARATTLARLHAAELACAREDRDVRRLLRECGPDADDGELCPPTRAMLLETAERIWGSYAEQWPESVRGYFVLAFDYCVGCCGSRTWPDDGSHRECDDAVRAETVRAMDRVMGRNGMEAAE